MGNSKRFYAIWDPQTDEGLSSYPEISWAGSPEDGGVSNVHKFSSLEEAKEAVKHLMNLFAGQATGFEILELLEPKVIWNNRVVGLFR